MSHPSAIGLWPTAGRGRKSSRGDSVPGADEHRDVALCRAIQRRRRISSDHDHVCGLDRGHGSTHQCNRCRPGKRHRW
jgi:hypothetical protein